MKHNLKILSQVQDDKKKNLVSIIIVSWNGLHWLKKSLPSLTNVTYTPIEIILVDNFSIDGTTAWVKKNFPNVHIISLDKNVGFAQGNNFGFEASKGSYILFLNNDVEVTPSFITELVKAIDADKTIGGVQSKILLLDDRHRYDSIGAFLTPTGFLYHYCFMNKENERYEKQIDLFTPKGACMLFMRNALNDILVNKKLFDPDAFAYFEETDMAHRIWLSGKRIVYVPSSIIYHKMGGTSTSMDNAFIQYHSFKNRIASYLKNFGTVFLLTILPMHFFCIEVFAMAALLKGKFSITVAVQKAILWNVFHFWDTYKKRQYIQKYLRAVPDAQLQTHIYKSPPLSYYVSQLRGVPFENIEAL